MKKIIKNGGVLLFTIGLIFFCGGVGMATSVIFLIDDFANPRGPSKLGTNWEGFTDQVMGGISTMETRVISSGDENYISMTGDVSVENNGGFVQVRLMLAAKGKAFDAREYRGVILEVLGNGEDYYIFLRTKETLFPWSYYSQSFKTSSTWQKVELPFEKFQKESVLRSLNVKKLTSLGIVAYGKEFKANIQVKMVGFY